MPSLDDVFPVVSLSVVDDGAVVVVSTLVVCGLVPLVTSSTVTTVAVSLVPAVVETPSSVTVIGVPLVSGVNVVFMFSGFVVAPGVVSAGGDAGTVGVVVAPSSSVDAAVVSSDCGLVVSPTTVVGFVVVDSVLPLVVVVELYSVVFADDVTLLASVLASAEWEPAVALSERVILNVFDGPVNKEHNFMSFGNNCIVDFSTCVPRNQEFVIFCNFGSSNKRSKTSGFAHLYISSKSQ